MVPLTTQSIRSLAVIGCRASLLLEDAALNAEEDVSAVDSDALLSLSGATADAIVPGISACCAIPTEANKKIKQLILVIISRSPDVD